MKTTFRVLSSEVDLAALRPVILEYFQFICAQLATHHGTDLDPEIPVASIFAKPQMYLPPIGYTLVAEEGQGITGTVSVKPLDTGRVEIKRLYVRPTAQGTGLGRVLLELAKETAREVGATEMYLDTLKSLTPAITLYRRDGFEDVPLYDGAEIVDQPKIKPHAIFLRRQL